jgi:hypothetical protein
MDKLLGIWEKLRSHPMFPKPKVLAGAIAYVTVEVVTQLFAIDVRAQVWPEVTDQLTWQQGINALAAFVAAYMTPDGPEFHIEDREDSPDADTEYKDLGE